MSPFKKVVPILLSLSAVVYVFTNIQPPNSWTQASFSQITAFFVPLVIFLVFSLKLFTKSYLYSILISSYLIGALILQGLNVVNFGISLVGLILIIVVFYFYQKSKKPKNSSSGIPKLSQIN